MKASPKKLDNRREFIKNLTLVSCLIGVDPFDFLRSNKIKLTEPTKNLVYSVHNEYQKFLRQSYNNNIIANMSETDAKKQYIGQIKLLAIGSDKNFKKYSEEKKINTLKKSEPFKPGKNITN